MNWEMIIVIIIIMRNDDIIMIMIIIYHPCPRMKITLVLLLVDSQFMILRSRLTASGVIYPFRFVLREKMEMNRLEASCATA